MATRLDTIKVCNPTDRDFEVRYDGEKYELAAGEETFHVAPLARHMAKHLSDREMAISWAKEEAKYKKRKETAPGALKTQMVMYDNPERRIVLHQVLKKREQVELVLTHYPQFGARVTTGKPTVFECIGDISIYDNFVEKFEKKDIEEKVKEEAPKAPSEPKEEA